MYPTFKTCSIFFFTAGSHFPRTVCSSLAAQFIYNDTGGAYSTGLHKIYKQWPNLLCSQNINLGLFFFLNEITKENILAFSCSL